MRDILVLKILVCQDVGINIQRWSFRFVFFKAKIRQFDDQRFLSLVIMNRSFVGRFVLDKIKQL